MIGTLTFTVLVSTLVSADLPPGFKPLFNGKSLDGWIAEGFREYSSGGVTKQVWSVRDGLLICDGKGFGFLRYDRELDDGILHVEFKMGKGCNSGVGIRGVKFTGPLHTRPSFAGYEIQIFDDAGQPPSTKGTGSLYRYVAPTSNPVKPADEWNAMEIECRGARIKVTLNGQVIQDVDQSTIAALKEKPTKGYISLQNHGRYVEFRNVAWRSLSTTAD